MTIEEACDITVEVWTYLAEHPECEDKRDLPPELYLKIEELEHRCPLCELFKQPYPAPCDGCPLEAAGERCTFLTSAFDRWNYSESDDNATRKDAAETIVRIVSEFKQRGYR
jgi:hypothetical protein